MKFSIVTPSFNSGLFIHETIESIHSQTGVEIQHIVCDGLSTDNTVEVLKKYPQINWVSEKDGGQSDAINKGFAKADGDVFAWQNADDVYLPGTFKKVAVFFEANPDVDLVYGNYKMIDVDSEWICDVYSRPWNEKQFRLGRIVPPQPTCFWRKRVHDKVGEINRDLHYCMDVDFYARVVKAGFKIKRLDDFLGQFRVHQSSKTQNDANAKRVFREHKKVIQTHFNLSPMESFLFSVLFRRGALGGWLKKRLLKSWNPSH